MLQSYLTIGDELTPIQNLMEKGIWIELTNPSDAELLKVSEEANISLDLLRAALDEEERSRIEVDGRSLLLLINVPVSEQNNGTLSYNTIPLGIIVNDNLVVTVCLQENPILIEFEYKKNKTFFTYKKTRFVLQILLKTASYYLRYLQQIDKKSGNIEKKLHGSMRNEELIELLNLEKSLVYFTTSLRANEIVMEKLMRLHLRSPAISMDPDTAVTSQILKMYAEDEEILEDVITENKQAIEMAETYSNILSGMMDAFASIISNNLNIVMKFLTSITIILALPTMVASFFGMNVAIPLQHSQFAFLIAILISLLLSITGFFLLKWKNML
ncbi:MAG: magnesium transporter CorA family protein [Firmicutes bacterium]|nr:magnesium transporter CorA family protein [Bacillota bacterium]